MTEHYYANCPVCSDATRDEVCICELALGYIGQISPLSVPGKRRKLSKEAIKWYKKNIQGATDKYQVAYDYIFHRQQPTLWNLDV